MMPMRLMPVPWLALLTTTAVTAADLDLSHYRPLPESVQPVPVPNGDFAKGLAEWHPGDGWSLAPTGGRNGSAALLNERTDRNSYVLCSRNLNLEPGATYRFSVWVKTEGVTQGEQGGATVALEGYGPQYLGGGYPQGPTGTVDWTLVSGVSECGSRNALTSSDGIAGVGSSSTASVERRRQPTRILLGPKPQETDGIIG